jgi:hypothetical protein
MGALLCICTATWPNELDLSAMEILRVRGASGCVETRNGCGHSNAALPSEATDSNDKT